ncbi:phosphoribosylglycinamide formyltransferase [Paenalcaligenes niemegkensis]|uniref:phosphoribosylglycinamide formyltransferase n=1 Tax=Paenalcaligenes niemegkensis TaxID=2895469 RepID=UPI0021513DB1|nr:phosphoribosylglycinamide formyltransferase [Paenalcaligenes niemegkensis]MCQ9616599.1 phosphoribosylglycinamide formyltransferase [Paenalcaligenes niemegkensis]
MTDTAERCRLVILISGRGSNMQAIVDTVRENKLNAQICAVISNKKDAAGLEWAQQRGIKTHVVEHKHYPDREAFDNDLARVIDAYQPDYVLLAGFMRILTAGFVERYARRLINIHPSLLPLFPGLNTHQLAIDSGMQWHGCTVHFVTSVLDSGPILAQGVVPILAGDTAQALSERLLDKEHQVFSQVVRWLAEDRISLDDSNVVRVRDIASRAFV